MIIKSATIYHTDIALMRDALNAGGRSDRVLAHFLDQISEDESEALRSVLSNLGRGKLRARRRG